MARSWFVSLMAIVGLLMSVLPGFAFDLSYWIWQRSEPLSESELSELAKQDVHTIYWHVGELEKKSGK
jgi:uncharacterized membrane protein YbaN (DUF454 family)